MASSATTSFLMRALWRFCALLSLSLLLVIPATTRAESPPSWLGVYVGTEERAGDDAGESVPPAGIPVAGVISGSPAAKAGLRARDRITTINGQPVRSFSDLRALMHDTSASQWLHMTVDRGGEEVELDARLDRRPESTSGLSARKGWIGTRAIDLPASLREHFGTPKDSGVMIAVVEADSPALIAGLELGDVVYEIDGRAVVSARDLAGRVERGGIGNTIAIVLMRSGVKIEIEATIVEEPEEPPEPDGSS